MLKGFHHLEYNMLGDESPLVFPILLILLSTWLIPSKIESYLQKIPTQLGKFGLFLHRLGPLFLVGYMILDRARAIFHRDLSYLEISQRLGPGEFNLFDLRLLLTGDGAPEIVFFSLIIFALLSNRLPSISISSDELRKAVQHRIMIYLSFSALVSYWIFFPESSYYEPSALPLQTTLPKYGDYSLFVVIFTALLILVNSELFAITTISYSDKGLDVLVRRTKLKMYLILPCLIYLLSNSAQSTESWWMDISQNGEFIMILFFILHSFGLIFVTVPSKLNESFLQHGDGRSNSLTFQLSISVIVLFSVSSLFLINHEPFDEGNGYLLQSSWLVVGIFSLTSISLILPNFGFDSAARPELWWIRINLIFAPSIIFIFTPYAIFLVPACLILLPISIVQPWIIETDVLSPSLSKFLLPLSCLIIFILCFSLFTAWPLMAFIVFGWLPSLFAAKSIEIHVKQLNKPVTL